MDYLKERIPLISETGEDVKKFKAKLIDTMYSHCDDLTTIDCLRKIQMEMDESVLESSQQPNTIMCPTIIEHSAAATITFLYIIFLLWCLNYRNIASYFIIFVFYIFFFILIRSFHKKTTEQNHETFKQTIQDMKNICDVLINIHRQT
jgi:hypothetical protein